MYPIEQTQRNRAFAPFRIPEMATPYTVTGCWSAG